MNTHRLNRSVLITLILFALLATAHMANGGNRTLAPEGDNAISVRAFINKSDNGEPQRTGLPETGVIMVNGRLLAGPNTSAQQRGGRLFLPIASIARALGDVIQFDGTSRIVTVRRQNGIVADFSVQLNQVRENGSLTLTVSGTADIVFPPEIQDLMLPVEIVAALLDVSVRREDERTITITRGLSQAETVRAGTRVAPWCLRCASQQDY